MVRLKPDTTYIVRLKPDATYMAAEAGRRVRGHPE